MSLEREVMCKQERRIGTILSCESEGRIARDINRERGVWWSGFPNSVTRCRASSLCKHTGSPGRASHCHCQPFKQSSMLNCSSPTYSLILTECNISGKPLTYKLIRSLFRNHSMPSSSEALTRWPRCDIAFSESLQSLAMFSSSYVLTTGILTTDSIRQKFLGVVSFWFLFHLCSIIWSCFCCCCSYWSCWCCFRCCCCSGRLICTSKALISHLLDGELWRRL